MRIESRASPRKGLVGATEILKKKQSFIHKKAYIVIQTISNSALSYIKWLSCDYNIDMFYVLLGGNIFLMECMMLRILSC